MTRNAKELRLMTVANEEQTNLHTQRAHKQAEAVPPKTLTTIQCWAVVEAAVSQRFAVLQVGNRLRGHVLGLEHVPYMKLVHTSPIMHVDFARGLVETRNTTFLLGEASEEYESWRATAH
jgi:hypothetical protein